MPRRRTRSRKSRPSWLRGFVAACLLAASPVSAQFQEPAREYELETPGLPDEPPPETVLPPIPPPAPEKPLAAEGRVLVRSFRFEGNTVFSDAELEAVTAAFAGREISSAELRDARDAVTRHYIAGGYVTSGAVSPGCLIAGDSSACRPHRSSTRGWSTAACDRSCASTRRTSAANESWGTSASSHSACDVADLAVLGRLARFVSGEPPMPPPPPPLVFNHCEVYGGP